MKRLFRAPIIVPVVSPVIEDGAVLVEDGRIIAVAPYLDLKGQGELIQYDDSALVPGLVNAHCHLELSHLADLGREQVRKNDITGWIRQLLARRREAGDDFIAAAQEALAGLYQSGVIMVADIGNMPDAARINAGSPCHHLFFQEMIGGLTKEGEQDELNRLEGIMAAGHQGIITGHAPYSTGPELLVALKKRTRELGQVFSLHLAESGDEIEFLQNGSGPMARFLTEFGFFDSSFSPPASGPAAYLDSLGLLDSDTLCVHCVQLTEEEMAILARRQAKVCLCPGSNEYLGVGRAPVAEMISHGLAPALGTDSLASNPQLNLWHEMSLLRQDHPHLEPEMVFAMATVNGAMALGASGLGRLAPGASADILAVDIPGEMKKGKVLDYLTGAGLEVQSQWLDQGAPRS